MIWLVHGELRERVWSMYAFQSPTAVLPRDYMRWFANANGNAPRWTPRGWE